MTGASGVVPHNSPINWPHSGWLGVGRGCREEERAAGRRRGLPGICSSPGKRWPGLLRAVAVEDHEENQFSRSIIINDSTSKKKNQPDLGPRGPRRKPSQVSEQDPLYNLQDYAKQKQDPCFKKY